MYHAGDLALTVLDAVDLDIEAGDMVAIIGPSGSGKSTLMNLIGCLDQPSAGQYRIDGRDTVEMDSDALAALRRDRFGFIFQRYQLLPDLDAQANTEVPAVYAGMQAQARRTRARALLERLGIGDRSHHRPFELSGGQQQRTSIARALMNGGDIILADEPTGALDTRSGDALMRLLEELNAQGHTVIIITHKFREVMAYADEVTVLRRGCKVMGAKVKLTTPAALAQAMIGEAAAGASAVLLEGSAVPRVAVAVDAQVALQVDGLSAAGDRGTLALQGLSLKVHQGEILGIAGVSGNGQRELVEALVGQRARAAGSVKVAGQPYAARRDDNRVLQLRALPEEPLRNACVGELSVAHNMALRDKKGQPLVDGNGACAALALGQGGRGHF